MQGVLPELGTSQLRLWSARWPLEIVINGLHNASQVLQVVLS